MLLITAFFSCAGRRSAPAINQENISLMESSGESPGNDRPDTALTSSLQDSASGASHENEQTVSHAAASFGTSSASASTSTISSSEPFVPDSLPSDSDADSLILNSSQDEYSVPAESAAPKDPGADLSQEESSAHVHAYEAQQRIVSKAYDEYILVIDKPAWDETITVIDRDAWDEVILVTDTEAWNETVTVIDQDAYDETITIVDEEAYDYVSEEIWGTRCRCGEFFPHDDGSAAYAHMNAIWDLIETRWETLYPEGIPADKLDEMNAELDQHSSFSKSREELWSHVEAVTHVETIHHDAVTHTEIISHPAETHEETIQHEAETHTEVVHHPAETHEEKVHHDAVYEAIYVCSICGASK